MISASAYSVISCILVLSGLLCGSVVAYMYAKYKHFLWRRHYLLIYDGESWQAHRCKVVPGGVEVNKIVYPASQHTVDEHVTLWVLCSQRPALHTHESLDRARGAILRGHMFRRGDDLTFYLKLASNFVILMICIYTVATVSGLSARIDATMKDIAVIHDVISKPLKIDVGPTYE